MFEMGRTKKLQVTLNTIAIISLIVFYIIYKRSHDYLGLFICGMILLISIVISILIHYIQKDVEENMKALQKRCLDVIENKKTKSK